MWSFQEPIEELHKIFKFLNTEFFNDELPLPCITIQSRGKRNALGWCSSIPIWADKDVKDTRHEINICAEYANMQVMDIVEIMLHEMVHYFADLKGIRTTSRNGTFHNKNYKIYAEKFGLVVTHSKKYGYAETKLSDPTLKRIESLQPNQQAFTMCRLPDDGKINKKRGSIKHTCPTCGNVARSTKEIALICGECNEAMGITESEDD